MAFDKAPTTLFSGYTSDGTNITIPIASLSGLTAAEANATTGDGREVLRSIMITATNAVSALPTADKPTKMTLTASNPQAISPEQQRQTYTASFTVVVDPAVATVANET